MLDKSNKRSNIEITFLNRGSVQEVEMLKSFALEFEHEICNLEHPILLFWRNGELKGYAQICNTPIIFPALNYKRCNAKDTEDFFQSLYGWAKIQHGHCLIPRPLDSKTFTEKVFEERTTLKKMNMELYEG